MSNNDWLIHFSVGLKLVKSAKQRLSASMWAAAEVLGTSDIERIVPVVSEISAASYARVCYKKGEEKKRNLSF